MASPRLGKILSKLKDRRKAHPLDELRTARKRLLLEELEDRRLMTTGPSLVAVIPTSGVFLNSGDTLHVAPRDMTFRFAQGNVIDGNTLANGFVVTSGGPDHILGDTDDQVVTPGYIGLGDTPREVVMRFASTLPDDVYSVTLVGASTPLHPTWSPIKDASGNPFNSGDPTKANTVVNFTLDTGAKIDAVVPQPITRVGSVLQQSDKTIDVYFDQQMNTTDVTSPAFYRLIDATNNSIALPQTVTYSDNATLTINSAGSTTLSYNGVSGAPITVVNQTTRVSITNAGTNGTGTFTLAVNGFASGSIPANGATVNSVLSTLNAVPGLAGNVSVALGPGTGTPGIVEQFDITFIGALTGRAVSVTFNPAGTGTAGSAVGAVAATNLTAATVQSNLNAISGLGGKVAVTGPNAGPYNIQFTGTLAGQNLTLIANNAPAANVTTSSQFLTLASDGVANLSFNGVSAASPLTVKLGTAGTTAAAVAANLNTISGLSGHVSVGGSAGGPFTITLTNVAGSISSLVSTNSATVTLVTNSQTLALLTPGVTTLAFAGTAGTTPLAVTTGANGTTVAAVQASVDSITGLSGSATVSGKNGGPFTITYTGAAQTANASLMAILPSVVVASMTQQPKATLTFATAIAGGVNNPSSTFKLEVGTATTADDKISTAQHIGNSMSSSLPAFIGDNPSLSAANEVNDVDLYRFDVQNAVTDLSINVAPSNGLDTFVRIFNADGTPYAAMPTVDGAGNGIADTVSNLSFAPGQYYIGVSSQANTNYDPQVSGSGQGGTATGSYSIKVTFDDTFVSPNEGGLIIDASSLNPGDAIVITSPNHGLSTGDHVHITGVAGNTAANNDWIVTRIDQNQFSLNNSISNGAYLSGGSWSIDNSSFSTASVLGVIGSGGKTIAGATIGPSFDPTKLYNIQLPGAGDAPGDRNIPFEGHITTVPGQDPDPTAGVETITYNFQTIYGFTPQGQQFFNSITEPQKQRVREALELYSRYLGVQFKEVDGSVGRIGSVSDLADMTIATGDPRAIAPTISTGTGNDKTGANGIAGVDAVVTNSDVTGLQTNVKGTITGALDTSIPFAASSKSDSKIVITSPNHGLRTGAFVQVTGVDGMTSANGVWEVIVLDQDHFYLADNLGNSQGNGTFTDQDANAQWTLLNISSGVAVVNALVDWGNSQYGGDYFQTAMQQVGRLLGLGDNGEAAALTIMGGGNTPVATAPNAATAEPVFPGDADIVYGQTVHRPESNDIDLYQFVVSEPGLFRGETVAERLPNSSLLNTVLTLYQLNSDGTKTEIAHNDDYYGNDSYLEVHLDTGTYFVAVTSVGNTDFDPTIADTGFGGRTQGTYNLSLSMKPDNATVSMRDATGVAFDGDAENNPGGVYQFWFQANTATNTIYVDKLGASVQVNGTTLASTTNIAKALTASANTNPGAKKIIRIVGNGGTDGSLSTLSDNNEYQIGYKDVARKNALSDGGEFLVPANVTVMIDGGVDFKMRRSNLNAGTTPQGLVSRSGGAIQVLGTPNVPVVFTSYDDDSVGGDDDGPTSGAQGGDYGGIVYRNDSDHERDYLNAANPLNLAMPVFLNYVNHATMTYGGGKVVVDSVEDVYDPIYMETARPTVSYNTIQKSSNAGMSANPNAFDDDGLPSASGVLVKFDDRRIGPDIHDNTVINNSLNGLFIRVRTLAGNPIDFVDVPTRWNDTDITHIVTSNLEIAGTPGGSVSPGSDRSPTTLTDGRLRIDSGMTVKLGGARIEAQISGQLIAEGTQTTPVIFTSVKDDRYGAGGTFDTNRDGATTAAAPGDWGGLVFEADSRGSIAQARIFYGGGSVPIEGGFDNFNAIEVQQADVRIANSVLQFNATGASTTDRNGRGPNDDATIFVRGAQPVIVNNIIRDNFGPAMSINADAMTSAVLGDYGQATGLLNAVGSRGDNYGPLIRGNRLTANAVNGMVIRGGTLTTETIWDDTDIVHVLFDEIIVPNHQVYSGLRIQSSATASLVVKAQGKDAGITASGTPLDIADRIGGTVQIIGAAGYPVVTTSLFDDTVGAGFQPDGSPDFDTNGDGLATPIGVLPSFTPATGPLQVTPNTDPTQLANAMVLRGLPTGVTITNATFTGGATQAGTFINGDNVPLGISPQGIILSTGDVNLPTTNTSQSFGTDDSQPGDPDLTALANKNNPTGTPISTFDASVLTVTINVDPASHVQSGAFSFVFGSDEFPEFVGSPFNDVFGAFINGGAPTNVAHDSRGNLVNVNSGFFDVDNQTGQLHIEYDGVTSALTATFPLHAGANVLKLAIGDSSDPILDSGVLITDLRFSTSSVGLGGTSRPPTAGDWRGIKLDPNSNDTNASEVIESEAGNIGTNADINKVDLTRTPQTAQFLGSLAPNMKSGDDTRRLGFQVNGSIAFDNPADVDVYSFNADSGTEVWLDIDNTSPSLDSMLELVDADGNVLARSTDAIPNVTDDIHEITGTISGATNPGTSGPIVITSANHGLQSGQQIFVSGVLGNTAANGPFFVKVTDSNHFSLWLNALLSIPSVSNANYLGGGTWTILPVDPGLSGAAISFDKDPSNGRDTYSTNQGPGYVIPGSPIDPNTGIDPGVTNSYPIIIHTTTAHNLQDGDTVQVSGVLGTTNANGVFKVTVIDATHFALNGTTGNGAYTNNGGASIPTWSKLVTTTRDPGMRIVLPNGSSGQPLKNAPFFIRVRSQPASLTSPAESGNTLNPGLTSGAYQLQVRLQQKDEKPGSTIRFADIRYATNAIEVHGLPYHSPLLGETSEASDTTNNTFAGAQNIGNLLQVDKNTITVGGQLSSATDVDWYQFDLDFDLLQYVNGYTDGWKTWSTMFDIDYADGLSRPDTTLSVFDDTGKLILIGRDSNVQDDQGTTTANLPSGSFGKHDAFIGPAQLPAVVPGQKKTYFVAVSSDRMIPSVLDQTFATTPTDTNVRLEPVESVARVVDDPLDTYVRSITSSSGTAEFPSNQYMDPGISGPVDQPASTLIDSTNTQALQANVRPFSLGDVQMFVTNGVQLFNIDPTASLAFAGASTDFQTTTVTPGNAEVATDFGTTGLVNALFSAVSPGSAGNRISVRFNTPQDLNFNGGSAPGDPPLPPDVSTSTFNGQTFVDVTLNTDAADITAGVAPPGATASTVNDLLGAIAANPNVSSLITLNVTSGDPNTDITTSGALANTSLQLSGGNDTPGVLKITFKAAGIGSIGNNIFLTFTRASNAGQGPIITVNGFHISITLDTDQHGIGVGTTASDLLTAINSSSARNLITATIVQGSGQIDIANPDGNSSLVQPPLQLSGGNDGQGAVEGTYGSTRLTTSTNTNVDDLSFRSDGLLYGYEGINAVNNGTAGQLILVDPGVGDATTAGTDSIPDETVPPTTPATVQSVQQITSSGGDAFAWGGTDLNGGVTTTNTSLYYAVPDFNAGASRLYQANPTTGSAAFVQGQPWGTNVTTIVPPGGTTGTLAAALITNATAAIGSTDFATAGGFNPNPPVSISFRSVLLGAQANGGRIHFTASHNGFDPILHTAFAPTVTVNSTLPADISVNLNLDSSNATNTTTFSNSTNQTIDIEFDADLLGRPGSQGNNIVVNFSRANRNGQGPLVQFGGTNNNTVAVVLDTSFNPGTGTTGTTAQQLIDAINQNPTNMANHILVVSTADPDPTKRVDNTIVTRIPLTGGADASTAQDVVTAINKFAGNVVLAAIQSGSGGTIVALEDPNTPGQGKIYNDAVLTGASDTPGFTTGLAFANDERTLYGVTDQGQFLRQINLGTSAPAQVVPVAIPDPFNPGSTLSGSNLRFSALSLGPQDIENGRYANTFFAMTDDGILTCLDVNGNPQKIFDTDGDGVADSTDILTGAFLQGGATGIAFSPFDFNLWHPTFSRQGDTGHDAGGQDGLATTRDATLTDPASGRQQDSTNMSYYFGFEPFQTAPGPTSNSYQTYTAGGSPFLGTGNDNLLPNSGQLGLLSATKQHELSLNPDLSTNSYNLPGAAYGSLITGNFSLASMSATDKPTFYFDYFLDTEDVNADAVTGSGNMRDSARVYIGPFTRFDNSGGPYVTGNVLDPTTTATATQFNGTSTVALSGIDGFYKGKALQFTSGALSGQTHIITDYIGATRTFVFAAGDSFTAPPASTDSFRIAYGYQTWDLLATNNSVLDSPNSSPTREGELGTFVSASTTALPSNPRQQVQLMQDNTGQWRQDRVDLSKYAGMTNLQLRFDFSTAGQMPDAKGQLPPWPQDSLTGANANQRGVYPPTNVAAIPGQDYLYEDGFGNLKSATARQNNAHEGFYVDNIIIGPAERGEMVIGAPANSTGFTDLATPGSITQPRNYDPFNTLPTQVLSGPYQLEIRRGAEYSLSDNGPLNDPNNSHNSQTPIISIDTNDRLIPDQRLGAPLPVEGFETGNFTGNGLKWSATDDAPWIITNSAATGSFAAASGKITNGQSSGLSIDLTTGAGDLTFFRSVDSEQGFDELRLFIDGRLAVYTQLDDVVLPTPQLAQWSGSLNFQKITVPVSAGHHNFRWTYDKDESDPVNLAVQDRAVIDEIHFPTPQVGFENVYTDPSLNDSSNPNAQNPPIGPTIAPPNSFAQIHFIDTLFPGFTQGGDTNLDRQQGHIQIEMNKIYAAQQVGILIDAGPRQAGTNNPGDGSVLNLPTLNTARLVPGVTVANNIVSNAGAAGIQYSGDPNTAVNGVA
ncbi:MAG TPA: choice-of-anchor L domain-containing protein, partial [Pirellulaceae bacterium]